MKALSYAIISAALILAPGRMVLAESASAPSPERAASPPPMTTPGPADASGSSLEEADIGLEGGGPARPVCRPLYSRDAGPVGPAMNDAEKDSIGFVVVSVECGAR